MKTYNIHQAKTHLSRLLEAVARGEEVVIAKAGKPIAKLIPVAATGSPRVLGALRGVKESADCWEPDPELEALFYGEPRQRKSKRVAERRPPR